MKNDLWVEGLINPSNAKITANTTTPKAQKCKDFWIF